MFQERLYQLRKERGISQEELADVVGVSRQAVQKWESGASRPDMDNLTALSRYFAVSMDYLVSGTDAAQTAAQSAAGPVCWPGWHYEYQSGARLFGLPLVHVNLGHGRMYRAKGVVAVGNVAVGVLSLGGVSLGLVPLGALSVGGLALGGLALGVGAAGGLAVGGLFAAGGLALSLGLAVGGCAVSASYAMGGLAVAGKVAAGGAASAPIAIGDAAGGVMVFPKSEWGPATSQAIREAITRQFPETPGFLVRLFSAMGSAG